MTLRPFVRPMSSHILDVAATSGGEFAVLTGAGVEIVDASLGPALTIPGPGPGVRADTLVALDDGRFLAHPWGLGSLYVGARGGELSSVDAGGERFFRHVAPTGAGFVATTGERALVDRLGERRRVDLPKGYPERGAVRWREGAIVSGHDGFAVLDASGEVEQTFDLPFGGTPSVVGAAVAFAGLEGAFLFDGGAPQRALSTLLGQRKRARGALSRVYQNGRLRRPRDRRARRRS